MENLLSALFAGSQLNVSLHGCDIYLYYIFCIFLFFFYVSQIRGCTLLKKACYLNIRKYFVLVLNIRKNICS